MVGSETADRDWVPDSLQGIEILSGVRREMRFLRCVSVLGIAENLRPKFLGPFPSHDGLAVFMGSNS